MFIAVANGSTKVSDADAALMTRACARQARYHIAPAWGLHTPAVVYVGHIDAPGTPLVNVPPGSVVFGLFDTDDQPGALAWHTEDDQGNVYGRVNCGAFLDAGGTVLQGPLTIASGLSHEIAETMGDAPCDRWVTAPDGRLWAMEIADPVEATTYDVTIDGHPVSVSDFVYPAFFDDSPPVGATTHHVDTGLAPFSIEHDGYAVVWDPTNPDPSKRDPTAVWGDSYPEWRKTTKSSPLARTARRTSV